MPQCHTVSAYTANSFSENLKSSNKMAMHKKPLPWCATKRSHTYNKSNY